MTGQRKSQRPKDVLAWAYAQRAAYHKGVLSEARIAILESKPGWSWELTPATQRWQDGFEKLVRFVEDNGRCPTQREMPWVSNQRLKKDGRSGKAKLTEEQVALLESVPGWFWRVFDDRWQNNYELLLGFVTDQGRLPMKSEMSWIGTQRQHYRTGKLSSEQIAMLEQVPGWVWNVYADSWNDGYSELMNILTETGILPAIKDFRNGWIAVQRNDYQNGTLPKDRAALLEALPGWVWAADDTWRIRYDELKTLIEGGASYPTGVAWIQTQRTNKRTGALSEERVSLLEALPGWHWGQERIEAFGEAKSVLAWLRDPNCVVSRHILSKRLSDGWNPEEAITTPSDHIYVKAGSWDDQYAVLVAFIAKEGRLPYQKESVWPNTQRTNYKKGSLSKERVRLLEKLPNWTWSPKEDQWPASFAVAKSYAKKNGKPESSIWVNNQRKCYRDGTLSADRISQLEALPGWKWEIVVGLWPSAYETLKNFLAEKGRYPTQTESPWANTQRRHYNNGTLSQDRIDLLEALPGWAWNPRDVRWFSEFEGLKAFLSEQGRYPTQEESGWVTEQRTAYRQARISDERVALLEALPGWKWYVGQGMYQRTSKERR